MDVSGPVCDKMLGGIFSAATFRNLVGIPGLTADCSMFADEVARVGGVAWVPRARPQRNTPTGTRKIAKTKWPFCLRSLR